MSITTALMAAMLLVLSAPASSQEASRLLRLAERLDQLDVAETEDILAKAESCIARRDFDCANKQLALAKTTATTNGAVTDMARVQALLRAEENVVATERRLARLRREREKEEEEHERRMARRQELEDDSPSAQPNLGLIIAQTANSVFQNHNKFAAAASQQQNAIFAQENARRAARADAERQMQAERETSARNAAGEDRRRANAAERALRQAEAERQEALAARRQQQESDAKEEERRTRIAAEKADKLAREEAERIASKNELDQYFAALRSGIRMRATKCPDGAGHYYATGSRPKLKEPSGHSCIDVSFEAKCSNSNHAIAGIAKNYIGMAGCFGDTYQIGPKPGCEVKDVQITITAVNGCS